jgi:hypothetical protein
VYKVVRELLVLLDFPELKVHKYLYYEFFTIFPFAAILINHTDPQLNTFFYKVQREPLVGRERQECRELPDLLDPPDFLEQPDQLELLVQLVSFV